MELHELIEIFDFEAPARANLAKMAYDYYASGANDQLTLRDNVNAFTRWQLHPRMMVDVSQVNMSLTLFGQTHTVPLMIAPTAFQRMAHPDGEMATARAASAQNVGMGLSTIASTSMEDVATVAPPQRWYQLYVYKDRGITRNLVERAEANGYTALALTVDTPKFGRRYADVRNGFHLPEGISMPNLEKAGLQKLGAVQGESGLAAYSASLFDASLTWKDVQWLKSITRLPVLVKGVLRADDAVLAIEHGVDGIIVSNHGGRQLDTVPATIDALPAISTAVAGRVPLLLDGGVRRGTDILKALVLGAQAVMIGRPVLWGLAVGGQAGVERVLSILREELHLAMMLCGCPNLAALDASLVSKA